MIIHSSSTVVEFDGVAYRREYNSEEITEASGESELAGAFWYKIDLSKVGAEAYTKMDKDQAHELEVKYQKGMQRLYE